VIVGILLDSGNPITHLRIKLLSLEETTPITELANLPFTSYSEYGERMGQESENHANLHVECTSYQATVRLREVVHWSWSYLSLSGVGLVTGNSEGYS
jgi:hypothetical protein